MKNKTNSQDRFPMRVLIKKTGVTKQAIHFYIKEGILPRPLKIGRNVAYYDEEYVKRLKQIKELQKRFIPLRVIKQLLTAREKEVDKKLDELQRRLNLPADILGPKLCFSFEDLKERTGLSSKELKKLEEMGVISSSSGTEAKKYEREDLELALLVGKLKEVGYSEERGFTGISGLTLYVNHIKEIAEEEIGRFFENLPENLSPQEAGYLADKGIEIYSDFIALLRKKLIKQKGREILRQVDYGRVENKQNKKRKE